MKTLPRSLIPPDFTYYRSGSRVFFEYYKKYYDGIIYRLHGGYEHVLASRICGLPLWSVIAEKIDTPPTVRELHEAGIHHGIIYWAPLRTTEIPRGWIRLPTWYTRSFLHSSRSAFSILDTDSYWEKWSSEARNHRKKTIRLREAGTIRIESSDDFELFIEAYRRSSTRDPNKGVRTQWLRRMHETEGMRSKRIYLGYLGDELVAGMICIDEGVTSEYYVSFYEPASRPYHYGIALMDRWYHDSRTLGMRYCDLDHMRDAGQSLGYRGYTVFKSGIADHDVYYHDLYIRFF